MTLIAPTEQGCDALRNSPLWRVVDSLSTILSVGQLVGGQNLEANCSLLSDEEKAEVSEVFHEYLALRKKVFQLRETTRVTILQNLDGVKQ